MQEILKLENKEQEKFLRKKTQKFDFDRYSKEEVSDLVSRMRKIMEEANGIGLAANQIGLSERVFVARWDDKFYAVFNPKLSKPSREKEEIEEGCLSVPGKYATLKRPASILLTCQNSSGKKIKIKAWDMLARIFQHEVDHLDGKLYIDRMSRFQKLKSRGARKAKYVFFGTPAFAGVILKGLIDVGMAPVAVVCNPDKPVGRKKLVTPPLTKQIAEDYGIKVFQPETKKDLVGLSSSLSEMADFGVVAAYAKIIPLEVINKFKLGIMGVHPSLLPKFRGPSPIQSVILSGEPETGTTLFMLSKGVDDGSILCQEKIDVENKNYGELVEILGKLSLKLLIQTLPDFSSGKVKSVPQDESKATFTNFFGNDAGLVEENNLQDALNGDGEKSLKIERMVRALNPEPGVYTLINGKRTKLLAARREGSKLVLEKIQKDGKRPEVIS